jgi:hypothetical protein
MAEHGAVEYGTAPGNDYAQHEQTYRSFVRLSKAVVAVAVAALVLMAVFLV